VPTSSLPNRGPLPSSALHGVHPSVHPSPWNYARTQQHLSPPPHPLVLQRQRQEGGQPRWRTTLSAVAVSPSSPLCVLFACVCCVLVACAWCGAAALWAVRVGGAGSGFCPGRATRRLLGGCCWAPPVSRSTHTGLGECREGVACARLVGCGSSRAHGVLTAARAAGPKAPIHQLALQWKKLVRRQ